MKKLFLSILVLGLLLSGCASGPPPADYGEAKDKNENYILLKAHYGAHDANLQNKAAEHCAQYNKFTYYYGWDFNGIGIFYRCKKGYAPTHVVKGKLENVMWTNYDKSSETLAKKEDLTFTIKDKKEQCTAIGFEPATEKFADCVLRLVELDVKSQQATQIALAQSQGNQQIADQLKKQSNDQSSQYFLDLGQKLLNPQSTVSAPSTSTCTISGGVYKNISCW